MSEKKDFTEQTLTLPGGDVVRDYTTSASYEKKADSYSSVMLPPLNRLYDMCASFGEGKKIEAIKMLRTISGLGLKEAKDTVEAIYYIPQVKERYCFSHEWRDGVKMEVLAYSLEEAKKTLDEISYNLPSIFRFSYKEKI